MSKRSDRRSVKRLKKMSKGIAKGEAKQVKREATPGLTKQILLTGIIVPLFVGFAVTISISQNFVISFFVGVLCAVGYWVFIGMPGLDHKEQKRLAQKNAPLNQEHARTAESVSEGTQNPVHNPLEESDDTSQNDYEFEKQVGHYAYFEAAETELAGDQPGTPTAQASPSASVTLVEALDSPEGPDTHPLPPAVSESDSGATELGSDAFDALLLHVMEEYSLLDLQTLEQAQLAFGVTRVKTLVRSSQGAYLVYNLIGSMESGKGFLEMVPGESLLDPEALKNPPTA